MLTVRVHIQVVQLAVVDLSRQVRERGDLPIRDDHVHNPTRLEDTVALLHQGTTVVECHVFHNVTQENLVEAFIPERRGRDSGQYVARLCLVEIDLAHQVLSTRPDVQC